MVFVSMPMCENSRVFASNTCLATLKRIMGTPVRRFSIQHHDISLFCQTIVQSSLPLPETAWQKLPLTREYWTLDAMKRLAMLHSFHKWPKTLVPIAHGSQLWGKEWAFSFAIDDSGKNRLPKPQVSVYCNSIVTYFESKSESQFDGLGRQWMTLKYTNFYQLEVKLSDLLRKFENLRRPRCAGKQFACLLAVLPEYRGGLLNSSMLSRVKRLNIEMNTFRNLTITLDAITSAAVRVLTWRWKSEETCESGAEHALSDVESLYRYPDGGRSQRKRRGKVLLEPLPSIIAEFERIDQLVNMCLRWSEW